MKKIVINLSNRWLYTFILIGIIILLGIVVYAFTNPATGVGHDLADIGLPICSDDQVLGMVAGVWSCVDMPSGGSDTNASTECSGTYTYLTGGGECRDVRSDGDIYDDNTLCNPTCTSSINPASTSCENIMFSSGQATCPSNKVMVRYTIYTGNDRIRCCPVSLSCSC